MSNIDIRQLESFETIERDFPKVHQPFRVHIEEEAFDLLVEHGTEDATREVGGVLVGEVLRDRFGPYIHVQAVIRAEYAQEGDAEFTITHDAWEHINGVMDDQHTDRRILGWYHTHPGFGLFLSDRDLFIQESFFNLPFQIAIVFDPKSREHGVFAWKDGAPWRLRSYFTGTRECIWDDQRTSVEGEKPTRTDARETGAQFEGQPAEGEAASAPSSPVLEHEERGVSTPLLWCFMALLLGLGGGWLLGSWKAAEAVREVTSKAAMGQAECASVAYQRLNTDLLLLLRSEFDDEGTLKPLEQIYSDLRVQVGKLTKAPAGKKRNKVVGRLQANVRGLGDWLSKRKGAEMALRQLEFISRQKPIDPQRLRRRQDKLRVRLASFHSEMAAFVADKDNDLVRRLLTGAADLDPKGYERYNSQYKKINPDQELPQGDRI